MSACLFQSLIESMNEFDKKLSVMFDIKKPQIYYELFSHPDHCAVVISLLFYFLGCKRGNGRMCGCLFVEL